MSAVTSGQNGLAAAAAKDWDKAITLLTAGIEGSAVTHPNPAWLLARAQAYQNTKQMPLALADIERAYTSALYRNPPNQRILLADIQYRRAVILGALKRFADSDACCVWSQQLVKGKVFSREEDDVVKNVDANGFYLATAAEALKDTHQPPADKGNPMAAMTKVEGASEWSRAYMLRSMVLKQMEALPADDPARKITVLRVPDPKKPTQISAPAPASTPATPTSTPTAAPAAKPLRVDMFQSADKVSLTLYAKGVDAAALKVEFKSDTRILLGPLPVAVAGASGSVLLELGGAVDTSAETVRQTVTPYKIELGFAKKNGEKWGSWGQQLEASSAPAEVSAPAAPTVSSRAAYTAPAATSAKAAPKNWEKVIEDEAPNADEPDSDVNSFFKKLYAGASPDAQRAMMKSFVESNGTSLSTDWASVSSGTVATQPPEGVDVKKWE